MTTNGRCSLAAGAERLFTRLQDKMLLEMGENKKTVQQYIWVGERELTFFVCWLRFFSPPGVGLATKEKVFKKKWDKSGFFGFQVHRHRDDDGSGQRCFWPLILKGIFFTSPPLFPSTAHARTLSHTHTHTHSHSLFMVSLSGPTALPHCASLRGQKGVQAAPPPFPHLRHVILGGRKREENSNIRHQHVCAHTHTHRPKKTEWKIKRSPTGERSQRPRKSLGSDCNLKQFEQTAPPLFWRCH